MGVGGIASEEGELSTETEPEVTVSIAEPVEAGVVDEAWSAISLSLLSVNTKAVGMRVGNPCGTDEGCCWQATSKNARSKAYRLLERSFEWFICYGLLTGCCPLAILTSSSMLTLLSSS